MALVVDKRGLVHPPIGLAQRHLMLGGVAHQDLSDPVGEPGIDREHGVLGLDSRVDDRPRQLSFSLSVVRHCQALLPQGFAHVVVHEQPPARQRGSIEQQPELEEILAATGTDSKGPRPTVRIALHRREPRSF